MTYHDAPTTDVPEMPLGGGVPGLLGEGERVNRLTCACGAAAFEVLSSTGEYETVARCVRCRALHVVHAG